jgi:hypothetical protein
MSSTPGSFSNRRRTVSSLRAHLSAICATEKCRSIEAVWGGISRTGCGVAFISPVSSLLSSGQNLPQLFGYKRLMVKQTSTHTLSLSSSGVMY